MDIVLENWELVYKADKIEVDTIRLFLEEKGIKTNTGAMPVGVFGLPGSIDIADIELYVDKQDKEKAISLIKKKLKKEKLHEKKSNELEKEIDFENEFHRFFYKNFRIIFAISILYLLNIYSVYKAFGKYVVYIMTGIDFILLAYSHSIHERYELKKKFENYDGYDNHDDL